MLTFDLFEPISFQKTQNVPLTLIQFFRDIGQYDIENDWFNKCLFHLVRIKVLNYLIRTSSIGKEFVYLYEWYYYYENKIKIK